VLGNGQDSFRWYPGDGSDVVEGENGTDTLDFNGAGVDKIMSLSPNGERSLLLRNVANIRMDMNGVERLDLTALGGADTVTVNDMSGTDLRRADVDLSAPTGAADGAADIVAVNGTEQADNIHVNGAGARVAVDGLRTDTVVAGGEPIDRLQVNALGGDDKVKVDPAASAQRGTGGVRRRSRPVTNPSPASPPGAGRRRGPRPWRPPARTPRPCVWRTDRAVLRRVPRTALLPGRQVQSAVVEPQHRRQDCCRREEHGDEEQPGAEEDGFEEAVVPLPEL
jgi:hypothetical protein